MYWSIMIFVLAIHPVLSRVVGNENQRLRNSSLTLGDMYGRGKRQLGCRTDQWQCADGRCIEVYEKCNGIVDCLDRSDETYLQCRSSECPEYLFRCTYGACVDGTAPCNGIQECADNSDELLPMCLSETRVNKDQYMCDNGQSISVTRICDGVPDCKDGSDEQIKACAGNTCDTYLFQCAYGACVDAGSNCNGKQDCFDGSDESDELCNRTSTSVITSPPKRIQPMSTDTCAMPEKPVNGRYQVRVENGAIYLNVNCDPGYAVEGSSSRILPCFKTYVKELQSLVPQCKRYCELRPHQNVKYYCFKTDGGTLYSRPCGLREFVGTIVVPTCVSFNFQGTLPYMYCQEDGWDNMATCGP